MSNTPQERFAHPTRATEAGLAFFFSSWQTRQLVADFVSTLLALDFSVWLNTRFMLQADKDGFRKHAQQNPEDYRDWLNEHGLSEEEGERVLDDVDRLAALSLRGRRDARQIIAEHGQLLLQTMLVRAYDAFALYIAELSQIIYRTRLAKLGADDDLNAFIRNVMEGHAKDLSRAGQKDRLIKEYKDILKVPLFSSTDALNTEVRIAETRHIIIHNRARISQPFVNRVRTFTQFTDVNVDKPLRLQDADVFADLEFLHNAVRDIDERVAQRFGLPLVPVPVAEDQEGSTETPSSSA